MSVPLTILNEMPAARLGDRFVHLGTTGVCVGVLVQGSPNVFTNNLPQVRITDKGVCSCDGPVRVQTGSHTVLVNNLGAARIGDRMTCKGVIITGSPNVMLGDYYVRAD